MLSRPTPRCLAPVLPLLAMVSPWWEDYAIKQSFLCNERDALLVDRNDVQASLISGSMRLRLFREQKDLPGLRFSNGDLRLINRDDELTLEPCLQALDSVRIDEA